MSKHFNWDGETSPSTFALPLGSTYYPPVCNNATFGFYLSPTCSQAFSIFRTLAIFIGGQETIKYVSSRVGNALSMDLRMPWRSLATTIKSVGQSVDYSSRSLTVSRSISQSVNWSVSQAISPTHAVAHSRIGSLASSLSTGHESTLVHSLVCLSVCTPINQSVGQSATRQSVSQPASQPISATQAAARSLVCSPVHPHIVSQTLKPSVNQSISQSCQSYYNQWVHVRCRSLALVPSLELSISRSTTRTFYGRHSLIVTRSSHVTRSISLWSLSQPV